MNLRIETRKQRYDNKKRIAKSYPISLCCINFMHDGNLGYLIRSAACFGVDNIYVIGSVPDRKILNSLSGSLVDYVKITSFRNPIEFINHANAGKIRLVSAEIHECAESILSYRFNFDKRVCLVVGHEESGIPVEILRNSEVVNIPMPGVGYCLNTSQTANILLYEAVKQFEGRL